MLSWRHVISKGKQKHTKACKQKNILTPSDRPKACRHSMSQTNMKGCLSGILKKLRQAKLALAQEVIDAEKHCSSEEVYLSPTSPPQVADPPARTPRPHSKDPLPPPKTHTKSPCPVSKDQNANKRCIDTWHSPSSIARLDGMCGAIE